MSVFGGYLFLHEDSLELQDAQVPKKIIINKEKLVIGRGSPKLAVDVTIIARKNDKDIISRQHAEITTTSNGDCSIRDMGALNGIFVNGIKINSHKLSQGDLVQFGGISNVEVGTKLTNSDVSLKYVYSTTTTQPVTKGSASKRKDDNQSSTSNMSVTSSSRSAKRSKGEDSLLSVLSPAIDSSKSSDSPEGKHKADIQILHVSYLNHIDKLKQKNKELEKEARTELPALKSQSARQLEAIAARDETIKKLKTVASEQQDHAKQLQKKLATQESHAATLEAEVASLKEKLAATVSAAAKAKLSPASSGACGLSRSTLVGSLQCSLCEGLLVEAAVLRCSHGFCRACIEQHWKAAKDAKSKYSTVRAVSPQVCRCPRCNASAVTSNTSTSRSTSSAGGKAGHSAYYVRSDHVDGLVWLLLESASSTTESKVKFVFIFF